jgi:molybdate transport system substrate-binding protein
MTRREVLTAFRRTICALNLTALFLSLQPALGTAVDVAAAMAAPISKPSVELTVSAAISLKDALEEIAHLYSVEVPGVVVHFNLGGSGTLQRQIEQGAPVDIFISASPKEMDGLAAKDLLLAGTRKDLVMNSVVLIVPAGTNTVSSFQDLAKPAAKIISIGEPQTVPAGKYAQETLTHLGLYDQVKAKLVLAKDVRQVLTYVETGNVDAGIVYATDAKISSKVSVVATAPEDSHSPVLYPSAVIKNSANIETAKQFLDFLAGDKAKAVFQKYGFIPAAN